MDARERFERTRNAVVRLDEVKALIMYDCDDWKPEGVQSAHETSDPTASRAIYAVDELSEKLEALRAEERELEQLIGESGTIIQAVRAGFSEQFGDWLEWRYIDLWTWEQFADELSTDEKPVTRKQAREKVRYWCGVTFDWIDSVGVSNLLRGQTEL